MIIMKMSYILITLIIINNTNLQFNYNEPIESIGKRLDWTKKQMEILTGNKIDIGFSNDKGMYCVTRKNLFAKQTTFRIPKEYSICTCIN
jgi:hypothetical protein